MAKQVSAIKFVGTMGNMVGSKGLDGKVIIREKAASVNNPQTEGQMDQRARFKLASQVSAMLDKVAKTALKANGIKTTRRGTTNKDILEHVSVSDGVAILNHKFNLVNHPVQTSSELRTTVAKQDNLAVGSITGTKANALIAKSLLIYDRRTGEWKSISALDTATSLSLGIDGAATDYDMYFYAIVVVPTTTEGRARLANLISQDVQGNYAVSPNRLDASNFGYTRMLAASNLQGSSQGDSEPADPNAAARELAEAKKALLDEMNAAIGEATAIGLHDAAVANGVSTNQEFVNVNMPAVTGTNPDILVIDYEGIKVSEGNLNPIAPGEADFSEPLRASVPIEDGYIDASCSGDDPVYLIIYNKRTKAAMVAEGKRSDNKVETSVPGFWQGDYVECYIFVKSVDSTRCSDTVYCGEGRIA